MTDIHFGTDGWRGIIAEDFTYDNLRRVVQAIMTYTTSAGIDQPLILIGYDTRFMSDRFARVASDIAMANGARVYISRTPVSTPVLSYAVSTESAAGGIMITASHNPHNFNGVKFKSCYGGSATPDITSAIESLIPGSCPPLPVCKVKAVESDFINPYMEHIKGFYDLDSIRKSGLTIAIDCMHGAVGCYIDRVMTEIGIPARLINAGPDPYFGGINPEPMEENLGRLATELRDNGYAAGFAFDGDGDRLGVMDATGRYLLPYEIFALLTIHMAKNRKAAGMVIKTVATSSLVDRVAAALGLEIRETPVGFKNICSIMLNENVMIGGEENGGVGFKGRIPERDGLLAGLMLLEMMAHAGKPLDVLISDMYKEFGRTYSRRLDIALDCARAVYVREHMTLLATEAFTDHGIIEVMTTDGVKLMLSDGSWVLYRMSGTEPLVRIYAETDDPVKLEKLLWRGKESVLD